MVRNHIEKLRHQQASLESRLDRLANIRAEYGNLVNEVRARTQILQDAERQLSEAQAARDAAVSCSLITRIDNPQVGEAPEGPGRSTILAGTTVAGLVFGLGVVFLLTPLDGGAGYGRRRNDFSNPLGRRAADQFPEARQPSLGPIDRRASQRVATSAMPTSPTTTPKITPEELMEAAPKSAVEAVRPQESVAAFSPVEFATQAPKPQTGTVDPNSTVAQRRLLPPVKIPT